MEPIAVIVFSVIMCMLSVQVVIEAVRQLVGGAVSAPDMGPLEIGGLVLVIVVKLLLFLYCRRVPSPAAQALAQDHFNDVLTNIFGTIFAVMGSRLWGPLDPIGALLFSLYECFKNLKVVSTG